MVTRCLHCHIFFQGNLKRHVSQCQCPLYGVGFYYPKNPLNLNPPTVSEAETRLLSDTYAASPSSSLLQLHNGRSIKGKQITDAWLSSHQDSLQHDDDDTNTWSMFDDSSYNHHDSSVSSVHTPPPAENFNKDETNTTFMQQFLPLH